MGETTVANKSVNGELDGCNGVQNGQSMNHFDTSDAKDSGLKCPAVDVRSCPPPIAVTGMAMRLPGGANSATSFWDLIVNKRSGRCRVPADRYNIDAFYDPSPGSRTMKTKYGHFINDYDLRCFDASFFSMTKPEAESADPQQRMLLEVVRECLESGGKTSWRGDTIGCYVGSFGEDWLELGAKDPQESGLYRITGSEDFALANRVSYEFDFRGPSMTIRTGCSSSMIGLHMACQALYNGDCSSAVVGGTNMIMSPTMSIAMAAQGVLSPTGSCHTFDAAADGYSRGEAINAIYIKKLSDAIADGDPIRAIIRSTSTNCDGKTPGIACPSAGSHETLIRRAYEVARLDDLSHTAFIECHGTGTSIGDPLEVQAIARVFGENDIYIGSVKPNVGHSEGASGITGIIKMVLALEKKIVPPNINFLTPNPKIPSLSTRLHVPVEALPWPKNRERVSLNSFGVGGANAHVVMDSASSFGVHVKKSQDASSRLQLLVISANHQTSMQKVIENYQEYIVSNHPALNDLAYTLGARREHLPYRAFSIADGGTTPEFSSPKKTTSPPSLFFTFTGQGAQWIGMAKDLIEDYPSFRHDMKRLDESLALLPLRPAWKIETELLHPQTPEKLSEAEFSQPLCTAVQIGVVNLLRKWNISPAAVVGHSSGEIAAAFASGALTAAEAITIAYYRGHVVKQYSQPGGMLAVGLGKNDITAYLRKGISIACESSPKSVTLSGDLEALEQVLQKLKDEQPEVFVRQLSVKAAYHSYHMRKLEGAYQSMIEKYVTARKPLVPFYSSVTGQLYACDVLGVSYWVQNLVSPVLFNPATQAMLAAKYQGELFLEIGPHSALAAPLRQILTEFKSNAFYVPTMIRGQDCTKTLLNAIGELHVCSIPVNFSAMSPNGVVLTNLPSYPWNHEAKYWNESRMSRDWRLRKFAQHEILGSRTTDSTDLEPSWRNILSLSDVPWVSDHKLHEDVVFPIAGYIAMVGEAIHQITGATAYTLKDVIVDKAMIFNDSNTVEIVSNFRPVRLTSTLESEWYEFSVSSHNGSEWIKHCVGQARGDLEYSPQTEQIKHLQRHVSPSKWYKVLNKVGQNYGKSFQGLRRISASTSEKIAVATVSDTLDSSYPLHPAKIDSCLQLFSVALNKGTPRFANELYVPISIGEVQVRRADSEILARATVRSSQRSLVSGDMTAVAQGMTVMNMTGFSLSCLEENATDSGSKQDAHACLTWKPDIDFMESKFPIKLAHRANEDLLLVEKLALLCMIEISNSFASTELPPTLIGKYLSWVHRQKDRAERGEYELVRGAEDYVKLDSKARLSLIEDTRKEVSSSKAVSVGDCIIRAFECFEDVYRGQVDPLDVLQHNGALTRLYDTLPPDYTPFLSLLSHKNPNLRILEVGAGTGGATSVVLDSLASEFGDRMYSEYHYTDVSAGFLIHAKDRFQHASNIKYSVLDISQDPLTQGYEEGAYDLVIAANVLHATPRINESLKNVRKILRPDGKLLLQELCPVVRFFNYVMGILPGWWLGEADGRVDEPYISPERWDEELRNAGFAGTDAVVYDSQIPYHVNANILATAWTPIHCDKRMTLLYNSSITPAIREVENSFINQGYSVELCSLFQKPSANRDIIALMDLEEPFFDRISASTFEAFKSFLGNLNSCGILWVTKSTISSGNPLFALVFGVARTLRKELSIDFATLEIDNVQSGVWDALQCVFEKFQRRRKDLDLDPEYEYAWINGVVNVGRFHWYPAAQQSIRDREVECGKRLQIGKHGLLKTLFWEDYQPATPHGSQVEIYTRVVGMNFKDVLISMGLVSSDLHDDNSEGSGLGCEASGVILRVGPDVKDLKPGDRVLAFASGAFSTKLTTLDSLCARMPDDMSFEQAATMPCVYSTVIYSLLELGQLDADQTVLIHSGCGGVGIAAIQISQMKNANIFVTVGNQEKRQYLIDTFKIPNHRIFNSRDASFLQDVMRATEGKGVDIVLNSLSGELLHASWQCVRPFGKMIEIGKRDLIGHAKLRMDPFEANRAFFGVDLAHLSKERPAKCGHLLAQCMDMFRRGSIKPVQPSTLFEAPHIQDAFRYMQKGQHIGKIVVNMATHAQELQSTARKQNLVLNPDAAYLLIGGLGGLGRSVASWMVERGARHLLFVSRSAGESQKDQAFISELISQNCSVKVFAGSVANLQDVKNAVENAGGPIAGVLQMSMVLKDTLLTNMTYQDWHTVLAPKVQGSWNLHETLKAEKLDFFVMFSSLSGIVGYVGQANYAAANTFLDAFNQYRRHLHLPASVLDIGPVDDVGYVSQNPAVLNQFRAINQKTISEQAFLEALEIAIVQSDPDSSTNQNQMIVGLKSQTSLLNPQNLCPWKRDVRMSVYRNSDATAISGTPTAGKESMKGFLSAVAANPSLLAETSSLDFLSQEIGACLCSFVQTPVEELDVSRSLTEMGIDSLLAIEFRNWWRQTLGLEITTLEILGSDNISALGKMAIEGLKVKHGAQAKEDEEIRDESLATKVL